MNSIRRHCFQKISCRQVRAGLEMHKFVNCPQIMDFTKIKYTGTISSLATELCIGAAKKYKSRNGCRKYSRPETGTHQVFIKWPIAVDTCLSFVSLFYYFGCLFNCMLSCLLAYQHCWVWPTSSRKACSAKSISTSALPGSLAEPST